MFGLEASFWNNLEKNYQEQLAKLEKQKKLEMQIGKLKQFPIKEMQARKWISTFDSATEKVDALLKFFGVASFEALSNIVNDSKILEGAFRISCEHEINEYALVSWIRRGEIVASEIEAEDFCKEKALAAIPSLRALTNEPDPNIFVPKLQKICASFGVVVVFVPELKGSRVSGLTRWLSPHPKAIIQLSLRYKTSDSLWFTVFHELGHVLLHEKKPFVEMKQYKEDLREEEANVFATNTLINEKDYKVFVRQRKFSSEKILSFSRQIGVHPGIVLGRLQSEKHIPWNYHNRLKVRYEWPVD